MITDRIHRILRAGALIGVLALGACSDDDTDAKGVEFRFRDADGTIEYGMEGGTAEVTFYSNCGHWRIVPADETSAWAEVWPAYGDDNGRTKVTVGPIADAYGRTARLDIRSDRYGVVGTIEVRQHGTEPYIRLGLTADRIRVDIEGTPVRVEVESNVRWEASVVEGESWITLGETDETGQEFLFTDNTGNPARKGRVRFAMTDGDYAVEVPVEQQDGNTTFATAQPVTVAELLDRVRLEDGRFALEENLRLDAWVVSDRAHGNMPDSVLFVQDASGRGLRLQLKDRRETDDPDRAGWYEQNRLLAIHMYGAEFREDADGNLMAADFSLRSSVKQSDATAPPADLAVALSDLKGIEAHANTLVRIEPAEFVFPYGCYVNASETADYESAGTTQQKTLWWYWNNQTSELYKQTYGSFLWYPNMLRDARGEGIPVYFSHSFTQKWARNLPAGKGAFTGVASRYRGGMILYMRNTDDDAIADDAAARLGTTLLQAGPWTDDKASVAAIAVGNDGADRSDLRYSIESAPGDYGFLAGGTGAYWVQGGRYRMHYDVPYAEDGPQYYAANAKNWWNNTVLESSVATTEAPGEAFILRTNVLRNATGTVYVSFTASSSLGGPGRMRLQWTESTADDLKGAVIRDIADYGAPAFDYTPYLWQYNFRLPDEMKGREVSILFRCVENENARLEGKNVTPGGTTRLGSIEIVEFK